MVSSMLRRPIALLVVVLLLCGTLALAGGNHGRGGKPRGMRPGGHHNNGGSSDFDLDLSGINLANCNFMQIAKCLTKKLPTCNRNQFPSFDAAECCADCRPSFLPSVGGCGCSYNEIPLICQEGEWPSYDDNGCVSCIVPNPEIDGCTLIELGKCALAWKDLPWCEVGAMPIRDNNTCCYSCRPQPAPQCSPAQLKECRDNYIGLGSSPLPYCNDTQYPMYNPLTCCMDCKVAPTEEEEPAEQGECTTEKFKECTAKQPVCANGEEVVVDMGAACCGSCRRPERTCDIASVVRCYASAPECRDDEEPVWVTGACCPSCVPKQLTNDDDKCKCSKENQICIGESSWDNAKNCTVRKPTCKARKDFAFTITAKDKLAKVLEWINAGQARHLVAEYVRRFCDKVENVMSCNLLKDALRDMTISTTLKCEGKHNHGRRRTHGGDRRCDGKGFGADWSRYQWRNDSMYCKPTCTLHVLVSVAADDETWMTPIRTIEAIIQGALHSDPEAQADGFYVSEYTPQADDDVDVDVDVDDDDIDNPFTSGAFDNKMATNWVAMITAMFAAVVAVFRF